MAPEQVSTFDGNSEPIPNLIRVEKELVADDADGELAMNLDDSHPYIPQQPSCQGHSTLTLPCSLPKQVVIVLTLRHGTGIGICRAQTILRYSRCCSDPQIFTGEVSKETKGAIQLGLTDPIWETVEACWKTQPSACLTVTQVLEVWEKEINSGNIPVEAEHGKQRLGFEQRGELFLY